MSVLQISNLSKSYGKIVALDDLSLTIEKGNIYGILGPNGSGKTTTLGIILNILKPDSGSYTWFDNQYGDKARLRIGSILETPNFYPYLNAIENLEIVRQIKNSPKKNFDELLDLVDLGGRKRSTFRTYSLGMKQRLAIAATLIGDPEVLIFDEPTNGLDPQGIAEVRQILLRISKMGNTVFLASHILDEVEKICTHVAIIKKGKLLATGHVGAILSTDVTVELDAKDNEALLTVLSDISAVRSIEKKDKWLECLIDKDMDVESFSSLLYEKGVTPTRFVARGRRLEEEFLEITKNA
jgi:ABC-2 type transport system ATP-binding protein